LRDVLDVRADGALREHELLCDLDGRGALRQQRQDLAPAQRPRRTRHARAARPHATGVMTRASNHG
jgi:hypothetical protein